MSRTITSEVGVAFGDCDPAGIVFFPNFARWMDTASHRFFVQCGLPPWNLMTEIPSCVGGPLLELHTKFHASATYGETLQIQTRIEEWRAKVFIQHHRIERGGTLICEGQETRVLCVKAPDGRLRSIPIPAFIRDACE